MPTLPARLRTALGRLFLLAAPVVVLLLGVEVYLRATAPADGPRPDGDAGFLTAVPSPELGWIFPPDTTGTFRSSGRPTPVATNAWGLRSAEVTDADTTRILVLGDSYAFGWGVPADSSFGELVGRALGAEVVNGALPGYSVYQQVRMLDFVLARTDVDLVLATLSLANDAVDEERIRRFAPDRLAEFDYGLRDPRSAAARLIRASRLLGLIDRRTTHLQFSLRNTGGHARDLVEESMADLAGRCRGRGLPLVWVLVPRAGEVREGGRLSGWLNRRTAGLRRDLAEEARGLGVVTVDLLPPLVAAQRDGDCYLPNDAHWNGRGHRVVAGAVLPAVKQALNGPR